MGIRWDFPLLGSGSLRGVNDAAITMFKGDGDMDGLAREVCQNSLDAKDRTLGDDVPVRVEFILEEIERRSYGMFDGYEEAIRGAWEFWSGSGYQDEKILAFLNQAEQELRRDRIPVLFMRDYGTTGLVGVDAKPGEKTPWSTLAGTEGISMKQDNTSGGSFGIGKNAPFAYSRFNMVFYNTFAKDGGRAFQGVTHIVNTLMPKGGEKKLASDTGKYLYAEDEYTFRPILPGDGCELAKIDAFQREDCGTDVAIVGFKQDLYPDWERSLAIALIKNFLLAIKNGRLESKILSARCHFDVNSETLQQLLYGEFGNEKQLSHTRQAYEAIVDGDAKTAKVAEDGDLTVYVKYDDDYVASTSRFRSTGMLINTDSQWTLPHYSVVVVVNDVGNCVLSSALREAEPPQHTEWRGRNVTDNQSLRKRVYKYLGLIKQIIQSYLDEHDLQEIGERLDAGGGGFVPDITNTTGIGKGTDGLKTDVRIKSISTRDGTTIVDKRTQEADASVGKKTEVSAHKAGPRKHRRKSKERIVVVDPDKGSTRGVSSSPKGKVRISAPNIADHRTFHISGPKYKLHLVSEADYEGVYVSYTAGREDQRSDDLPVANYKQTGSGLKTPTDGRIGPIKLHKGGNDIFIEFKSKEILAVTPTFTMEVRDA